MHGAALFGAGPDMKTIFVNRYFYPDHSATSQLLTDLAFHLAAAGENVHVITSRQRYDDPLAMLAPRETVSNVHVHRVWTSRLGRQSLTGRVLDYVTFYATAAAMLLTLARRGDSIVAKTDPPMVSVVAAVGARMRGAHIINWVQDVFPEIAIALGVKGLNGPFGRVLQWLRDSSLRAARMNVVLGRRMAAHLVNRGVPQSKVEVVHNWVDDAEIVPIPTEANRLRREWHLEGKFVIGYSGNMGRAHEFDTILDAAQRLNGNGETVFLFIGGGTQKGYIQDEIARRGLKQFLLKPYQDKSELPQSLSIPDVHLISLRPELEGYIVPSKFYGVAAAGRPVVLIGDPQGEIGALIRDCECGAVVEQGDAAGLAETIARLHRDPALRAKWGANARRLIEKEYSKRRAFELWGSVLKQAAGPR